MRSRSSFFYAYGALLVAWALLLWLGIGQPAHPSSEETHYIPAARKILVQKEFVNSEHPPLAKIAIASGMAVLGDSPQGWRLAPVLAALLFLAGVLRLARALGFSRGMTLVAGVFVALNGIAFALGRLAMLEMPMLAPLVWGIALWLESQHCTERRRTHILLLCSGAAFGFSAACKWVGGMGFVLTLSATSVLLLLRYWKASFSSLGPRHEESEFYRRALWRSLQAPEVGGALLLGAFVAYFCAFIPLYGKVGGWQSLTDWVRLQTQMWELQQQVTQSHPYGTQWYQWFLPSRTIWFEYTREAAQHVRAIFIFPNSWITLLGAIGFGWAARQSVRERDFGAFWLVYFYLGLYLMFAIIPRRLSFYYYYAPAFTFWSLLAAWGVGQIPARYRKVGITLALLGTIGFFSAYYPLYAARLISETSVYQRVWLRSWI